MKKISMLLVIALLMSLVTPAYAVLDKTNILFEDRFSSGTEGYTYSMVTDSTTHTESGAVNLSRSTEAVAPSSEMDDQRGYLYAEVKKNDAKAAKIRIDRNYYKQIIHNFADSTQKTVIETKLYYNSIYDEVRLFLPASDNNGAWIANNPLIMIKAQKETNNEWIVKDINNNALISYSDYESDEAAVADWAGKWHHFMVVLSGNTYDVYHNGTKMNKEPITVTLPDKDTANLVRFIHFLDRWGDSYMLMDDVIVQTMKDELVIQNTNIDNGHIGADANQSKLMLDFNNLIDEATLSGVKVTKGGADVTADVGIRTDAVDKTMLIIDFGSLDELTEYSVDLSGLKDFVGNGLSQNLTYKFTTGIKTLPAQIAKSFSIDFDSEAQKLSGTGEACDGAWKITSANAAEVTAQVPGFPRQLHTYNSPSDMTTIEMKIKSQTLGNVRKLFMLRDSSNAWADTTVVLQEKNVRLYGSNYQSSGEIMSYYNKDEWVHVYEVWRGNACDVYVNGEKVNNRAVMPPSASTADMSYWNMSFKAWGEAGDYILVDELRAQSLAELQLQDGDIADGEEDVSAYTETLTFDFNNLIDESSLSAVTVTDDTGRQISVSAALDAVDKSKVILTPDSGALAWYTGYTVNFAGISDIFGTAADDTVSFTTAPAPGDALITTAPAQDVQPGGFTPTISFNTKMDADTLIPENITVTPELTVKNAVVSENCKSVRLVFGSNLLADTSYTVSFNENVKTYDGLYGVEEGQSYTFTTSVSGDRIINEFDTITAGDNGVYAIEGAFQQNKLYQEEMEDKTKLILGNNESGSLIFCAAQGIRDFQLEAFDINYSSSGRGYIELEQSADGESFSVIEQTNKTLIKTITGVGKTDTNAGVTYELYRYTPELQADTKYIRVSLKRGETTTANYCWTPLLRNAVINQTKATDTAKLASSSPAAGGTNVKPLKSLSLKFDRELYKMDVTADKFAVSDAEIDSVSLTANNRTVNILLKNSLSYNSSYTLAMSGVRDLNGNYISSNIPFTTENATIVIKAADIIDGKAVFTVQNVTDTPQSAVLFATRYNGEQMTEVKATDISLAANEIKEETLSALTAAGSTDKLFGVERMDTLKPLKRSYIGSVDKEFYPGFVRKAVTLSYDDGPQSTDIRMMKLLDERGLKMTLNVNSDRIAGQSDSTNAEFAALAANHEIANHSKGHPNYYSVTLDEAIDSIKDGRSELEEYYGREVRGFAYPYNRPYNTSNEEPINEYLINTGVAYARPSTSNGSFDIPTDFMNWQFTCHHPDLDSYKNDFYELEDTGELKLLAVWGHSWEFSASSTADPPREDTWNTILVPFLDELYERRDEIWSCTNIELYDYIQAKNNLVITDSYIYNPSDVDVYVKIDGQNRIVPAGQTIN